jgi:hypothetical protein
VELAGIVEATDEYEAWLRGQVPVWQDDLDFKHQEMASNPFAFLRATYYRWIPRWLRLCPESAQAPRVLAVGDLQVENFGTWRDAEARLVWGVNDFDEVAEMPYTADLVRLATSARLALKSGNLVLTTGMACDAILDGYVAALTTGGRPLVLAEHDRWLRRVASGRAREPARFWGRLRPRPQLDVPLRPLLRQALVRSLPEGMIDYRLRRRRAGLGSLGRERVVAEGEWRGAQVAREVKSRVPSAWTLVEGDPAGMSHGLARQLLGQAVRSPDPDYLPGRGCVVRRLAPDCSRIEMADMPGRRDDVRLLRAMGWETGNLHLGTAGAAGLVLPDLELRDSGWLVAEARRMTRAVLRDWRDWRAAHRNAPDPPA